MYIIQNVYTYLKNTFITLEISQNNPLQSFYWDLSPNLKKCITYLSEYIFGHCILFISKYMTYTDINLLLVNQY